MAQRKKTLSPRDDDIGLTETNTITEYDGTPIEELDEPPEPPTADDAPAQPELNFATPPPPETPHPDTSTINEIIEAKIRPLQTAIEKLAAKHGENVQANDNIFEILANMNESLHELILNLTKEVGSYGSTVSAMKFQTGMMQSFIGQPIPLAVREEIDRLYAVEERYNIAELAERVVDYIIRNPTMIKLPEDEDERQMMLAVINAYHVRAHIGEGKLCIVAKTTPAPTSL